MLIGNSIIPNTNGYYGFFLEESLTEYIIFNFIMCRRREWDLSEEAESTAEIVKALQEENTELCDKERRRVQDEREKEGDLEENVNMNNKKDIYEVRTIKM